MVLFEEQVPVLFVVDDRAVVDMVWIDKVRKRNWMRDAMGLWLCAWWTDGRQPRSLVMGGTEFVSATFTF